jgi:hypothetical protein
MESAIMNQRNRLSMCQNLRRTILVSFVALGVCGSMAGQDAPVHPLYGNNGAVACLVSADANGPRGEPRLRIEIRSPGAPDPMVLSALPPEQRDFSTLPIRVVLLAPTAGAGSVPVQRLPISFDPTLDHPAIDGAPSGDGFVRAIFPRDWVVAGATILGERMVVAPSGTKVTSQTRCAITEADAAQWR